jgi:hypothetical protein
MNYNYNLVFELQITFEKLHFEMWTDKMVFE